MKLRLLPLSLAAFLPLLLQQGTDDDRPAPPEVGKAAPTLRLNNHLGEAVSVGGKNENWTVLAFFPKAMTPG